MAESFAFDPDLYHRALTGRGAPIRSEEVLELLETLEQHDAEFVALQGKHVELQIAYDAEWIVPKEEPDRPCGICVASHDRGDGRCERHGRYVVTLDELGKKIGLEMREAEPELRYVHRLYARVVALQNELEKSRSEIDRLQKAVSDLLHGREVKLKTASTYGKFGLLAVASGVAGDPGADVQADRAARLRVASPERGARSRGGSAAESHEPSVAERAETLEPRTEPVGEPELRACREDHVCGPAPEDQLAPACRRRRARAPADRVRTRG
jgi:hypothetical protein